MGNRLYVGNLPYSMRDNDLQTVFAAFGEVKSARVMMERDTGRSKGFGFVEMGDEAQAQAAIAGMHGQDLGGRAAVVNEARPAEPRPPRDSGGYGGGARAGYGSSGHGSFVGNGHGSGEGGGGDGRFRSPYGGSSNRRDGRSYGGDNRRGGGSYSDRNGGNGRGGGRGGWGNP